MTTVRSGAQKLRKNPQAYLTRNLFGRPAGAQLLVQSRQPLFHEPSSPETDRHLVQPQPGSDVLVGQAVGTEQNANSSSRLPRTHGAREMQPISCGTQQA